MLRTIGDLLTRRAALSPAREAITELATSRRWTYRAVAVRAHKLANTLRHRFGVRAGDRVGILAHNDLAHIDLLFAAAHIGAIAVPLNWRLAPVEVAAVVADCGLSVLIVGPEHAATAAAVCDQGSPPHLIALGGADVPGPGYDDLLAAADDGLPERPAVGPDDTACLLYTSGTTGAPKGAMIPHRQILWNCINTAVSWGLRDTDVSPVFVPLFHAGGLFAFLTPLFYLGGRIVLGRGFDGEGDLHAIERERCTVVLGVPTIYRLWRESTAYDAVDLASVRFFISGGAPCPPSLMQAWRDERGVVFRQGYGLTEVGPNCFAMSDEESVAKAGSIGRPGLIGDVALVDGTGARVATGEVGELALRGPHVCTGYWGNAEATDAALRDGWFHTGDMARCDEDGFYTIVGRGKEMIISGGENVYAAEVESVFSDHPGVAEAALIGRPDDKWGEVGVMIVIPREAATPVPTEDDLLAFCAGRLARYKIPRQVVFAPDFPRTALGKPSKPELRRRYGGSTW